MAVQLPLEIVPRMVAKAKDSLIIVTIESILLRRSEDGKGTTTPGSVSSFESGSSEDFHRKLEESKRNSYHSIYPRRQQKLDLGTAEDS